MADAMTDTQVRNSWHPHEGTREEQLKALLDFFYRKARIEHRFFCPVCGDKEHPADDELCEGALAERLLGIRP